MQNRAQNRANVSGQNQVGANVQRNDGNRVQLTSQQRTHIRENVLSKQNVPRVNHVNFALRTGVVVPESVHYVSVSDYPTLVNVFPEYRDDDFVVAEDQIVILTPQRRVVDVVPLNGSASASAHGTASGGVELSSSEVREVQQVLVDRGYDIQVDGVWGPATRHALITFQQREGLPATGVISTQTVASLGLRGKIAESHIQGGASTTGQGNADENGRMNVQGNQPDVQHEQHPSSNQNANAPENSRSTIGQGGNPRNDNQPNAQGNNRPPQNHSANRQGGGRNQSTNGQGGPSGANVGEQHGANGQGQENMQQSKSSQK